MRKKNYRNRGANDPKHFVEPEVVVEPPAVEKKSKKSVKAAIPDAAEEVAEVEVSDVAAPDGFDK